MRKDVQLSSPEANIILSDICEHFLFFLFYAHHFCFIFTFLGFEIYCIFLFNTSLRCAIYLPESLPFFFSSDKKAPFRPHQWNAQIFFFGSSFRVLCSSSISNALFAIRFFARMFFLRPLTWIRLWIP